MGILLCLELAAQTPARLLRYPDVSQTQITFSYGGDIWIVGKQGGIATKLSSPAGNELYPKFSPDGNTIAFSGNYDGNVDIYTMPAGGGLPTRVTHHGMSDYLQDWYPDGQDLLYTHPCTARSNGLASSTGSRRKEDYQTSFPWPMASLVH